ncbi:MAG: M20/M25/M40 family metallo-hydrolase [Acidobacteria bacterium]|nr:M20/M25/M40 family metallo-hydrolase [Acidobacteriota bacterium]
MDDKIRELAEAYKPLAIRILKEAIRIPADYVDKPADQGGDPDCGLSNHEGPRLEYLKDKILEVGAVDGPDDVGFDTFGNLVWTVADPDDGVAASEKTVIYFDGHTDTVKALRPRWHETIGGGIDSYLGMTDPSRVDQEFLRRELGWLPDESEWEHLVWGRGSADQLSGVICQIIATKVLRELRPEGSLRGVIVRSYATVAEEDNDGGGPMYLMREVLPGAPPEMIPDVFILSEPTGSAFHGALGIYRGQRGRMQIEVEVTGKSCHGSMPAEGRNPLEYGGAILAEAAARHARGDGFLDDDFLGKGTRTASFATLETPSDCAVPERFTFRFDRRLTAGETPEQAVADIDALKAVARARDDGLVVEVRVPLYDQLTWRGHRPGNPQIYPGWATPEEHPAIQCAAEAYRRVVSPGIEADAGGEGGGGLRKEPRVSRWVFSTDGVGVPVPTVDSAAAHDSDKQVLQVPAGKRWVEAGAFRHPAMFGFGPGHEENTHKIGECVDSREIPPVVALYARFPSLYREKVTS